MARFMAERHAQPGQAADATTAKACSAGPSSASRRRADTLTEEDFRTAVAQPAAGDAARSQPASSIPAPARTRSTSKLDEAFERHAASPRPDDAQELAEWVARPSCGIEVDAGGADRRDRRTQARAGAVERLRRPLPARDAPHGAQPAARPARHARGRTTCYTMDHLRSGHRPGRLRPGRSRRPSTSAQGMKEFDAMWEGVQDKVTDTVFRMEEDEELPGIGVGDQARRCTKPPRRPRDDGHPRPAGRRHRRQPADRQEDGADPQPRRQGRPQRPVPVRQRQEVQELLHAAGGGVATLRRQRARRLRLACNATRERIPMPYLLNLVYLLALLVLSPWLALQGADHRQVPPRPVDAS